MLMIITKLVEILHSNAYKIKIYSPVCSSCNINVNLRQIGIILNFQGSLLTNKNVIQK